MSHSAPPQDAVSVLTQEFLVDDPCSIAVNVPGAVTTLRPGADPGHVEVHVSVAGCLPEEANRVLDRLDIGSYQRKDTVRVASDADRSTADWWRWLRTLDVTLRVELRCPARVKADLSIPGGEVDVANLTGHFDLDVMSSPCRVHNVTGTIDIRAESSDVTVEQCSGDELLARVATGRLTVTDLEADSITLRAVDAPTTLRNATGRTQLTAHSTPVTIEALTGPCTARGHGGTLHYRGCPSAETDLSSIGGELHVTLPSDCGVDLSATAPSPVLDDSFPFEGDRTGEEIEGTLNGGGVPLRLCTRGAPLRCTAA
jgi:hypothetical protein